MTNRFWIGGEANYDKAIKAQHDAELATLREQLKSARTEAERLALDQQIASLNKNYRERSQAARRGLF